MCHGRESRGDRDRDSGSPGFLEICGQTLENKKYNHLRGASSPDAVADPWLIGPGSDYACRVSADRRPWCSGAGPDGRSVWGT